MGLPLQVDVRKCRAELAFRSFWFYLKLKDPEFYHEGRPHLKEFADILQSFLEGTLKTPSGKKQRY